jgi:hypothetical protein
MAWTLLPVFPERIPVLHTIRDPWKVIDSLACRNSILRIPDVRTEAMRSIRDTIRTYCPEAWTYENRVDRAAAFVIGWNDAIAKAIPDGWRMTYQVERLDVPIMRQLLHHVGIERDDETIRKGLDEVRRNTNAGYSIIDASGISDPLVEEYIKATFPDSQLFTRTFTKPKRLSMDELAEQMRPELLEQVNEYAARYGYPTCCTTATAERVCQ